MYPKRNPVTAPDKNSTSILLLQGFVMNIGNGQTLVSCPTSGRFDVRWKNRRLPNIKKGQYITFTGQVITFDLGRSFLVIRAQLMKPKSLREVKVLVRSLLEEVPNEQGDNLNRRV